MAHCGHAQKQQTFEFIVPHGALPNQEIRTNIHGQSITIKIPPGSTPGQPLRFNFKYPVKSAPPESSQQLKPYTGYGSQPVQNSNDDRSFSTVAKSSNIPGLNSSGMGVAAGVAGSLGVSFLTVFPAVGAVLAVCDKLNTQLQTYQDLEKNCVETLKWCKTMKRVFKEVELLFEQHPHLGLDPYLEALDGCELQLNEFHKLILQHRSRSHFRKFVTANQMKQSADETNTMMMRAIQTIQLLLSAANLRWNMSRDTP